MKNIKEKLVLCTFLSVPLTTSLHAAMTAKEVMDYAKTAVGSRYKMGHSRWDPNDRSFGYTDCAGLVLKAWRWPLEIPYRETLKGSYTVRGKKVTGKLYTGSMFETKRYELPWSVDKDFDNAKVADAYTYNNGKEGHTFLVTRYDENKNVKSVEARNPKLGVGYFTRTKAYLKGVGYRLMRHRGISRANATPATEAPARQLSQYEAIFHTVTKGDTLSALAKKHKVTVGHIVALNPSKIKNFVIKIGDRIQVK